MSAKTMNCERLNDIFHSPFCRKVYCDVDSRHYLAGNGMVEIEKQDASFYFGVPFVNGVASGMGFVCSNQNTKQIVGIQFENDHIVSVNDSPERENAIVDEDSGRRWEGWVNERHVPCGFGRFYDDNGNLEYEGLCWEGQRCGFGVSYHAIGSIASISFYVFNKKFGKSKDFDLQGRFLGNALYCNGSICVTWGPNQSLLDGKETAFCSATSLTEHLELADPSFIHSCFYRLKTLTICAPGVPSVPDLVISILPSLLQIHFLPGACSRYASDCPPYLHVPEIRSASKTLEIVNCPALVSIRFDEFACSDFTALRIESSSLEECIFGEKDSYCFYAATKLFLQSPKLRVLRFGEFSFYWTEEVRVQSKRRGRT